MIPVSAISDRVRALSVRDCRCALQRVIWNIKRENIIVGFSYSDVTVQSEQLGPPYDRYRPNTR
jgi:hypothetical protein